MPDDRSRSSERRVAGHFLLALIAALATTDTRGAVIGDPGQGFVEVAPGETGASELSGIAHAGGDRFFAVSDDAGRLFPLRIEIDRASGTIETAVPGPPRKLAGGIDLEGIALVAEDRILVCDEIGPALREHALTGGSPVRTLPIPPVFRKARFNLGIESLSRSGDSLWIANEEALRGDGPLPTPEHGTRVRLQRLDLNGSPTGQWAYETDPYPGAPLFGRAHSGVSDLLALPTGELLVLERSFSSHGFRSRIYQVDFTDGTPTGALPDLEAAAVTPVTKRLLWDSGSFSYNFEGLSLGPLLAAGSRSLLLVADDGGAGVPGLYALRLEPREAPAGEPEHPVPHGEAASAPPGP